MSDLAIVVPDKDIEQSLRGLFSRPKALGIRGITFEMLTHPNRDPGCYHTGHELLAALGSSASHALIVFDRAWDGAPSSDRCRLERDVENRLRPRWGDRGGCVVIDPEIEVWVWSTSPHVARVLGWEGRDQDLRSWLTQAGLWPADQPKPSDPKHAFERAMRLVRLPASSALFGQLAKSVSVKGCTDPSFERLVEILRRWFAN